MSAGRGRCGGWRLATSGLKEKDTFNGPAPHARHMPVLLIFCTLVAACVFIGQPSLLFAAARGGVGHPSITRTMTLGPASSYSLGPPLFDDTVMTRPRLFPSPRIVIKVTNDTIALASRGCRELLLRHSVRGPGYGRSVAEARLSPASGSSSTSAETYAYSRKDGFYIDSVEQSVDYLATTSDAYISIGGRLWSREQVKLGALTSGLVVTFAGDDRYDFSEAAAESAEQRDGGGPDVMGGVGTNGNMGFAGDKSRPSGGGARRRMAAAQMSSGQGETDAESPHSNAIDGRHADGSSGDGDDDDESPASFVALRSRRHFEALADTALGDTLGDASRAAVLGMSQQLSAEGTPHAIYSFSLPSACLVSRSPPPSGDALFIVAEGEREVVGQVMTFFALIAGALCALCTLAGALLPLLLLQVFAALSTIGCAPHALLVEAYYTHFVLFPSRALIGDSLGLHESTIIIIGGVAVVAALLEGVHYALESRFGLEAAYGASEERMAQAAEAAMRDAARRGVRFREAGADSRGRVMSDDDDGDGVFATLINEKQKKAERQHKKQQKKLHQKQKGGADGPEAAITDGEAADGVGVDPNSFAARRRRTASVVDETLQSVREAAAQAAGGAMVYLPMSPYIGACIMCALLTGAVAHCGAVVFNADSDGIMLGIAVLGLLLLGVGVPMLAVGVWMRKGFVYCPYRVRQGGLPPSMHLSGVWGPNRLRLRFGIFCEDFRESRRAVSIVSLLYAVLIALLVGSGPQSRSSCSTVLGISAALTFAYGALMLILSPMRSRLNNYCLTAVNIATFAFEVCMLVFVGNVDASTGAATAPTPRSVHGAMACGSIACVASILFAMSHFAGVLWEVRGSRAARHTSLHRAEGVLDAEMAKLQTQLEVDAGVEEALEMYRAAARDAADEDDEGLNGAGHHNGHSHGHHGGGHGGGRGGAGAQRHKLLERARIEALERARAERISGMRFAHDTVRGGASLAVGDERHPSYADFLLSDPHMVPEGTRQEMRTAAMVRRAAEQRAEATGIGNAAGRSGYATAGSPLTSLASLTFDEQLILAGRSQHHGRHHRRADAEGRLTSHNAGSSYSGSYLPPDLSISAAGFGAGLLSAPSLAMDTSAAYGGYGEDEYSGGVGRGRVGPPIPHIYSSSVVPQLSAAHVRRVAEAQRREERAAQMRSLGLRMDDDDL